MNRRGFLGSILAAAAAPAIVRADSLMRIVPRDTGIRRVPWQFIVKEVELNDDMMIAAFEDGFRETRNPGDIIVARLYRHYNGAVQCDEIPYDEFYLPVEPA